MAHSARRIIRMLGIWFFLPPSVFPSARPARRPLPLRLRGQPYSLPGTVRGRLIPTHVYDGSARVQHLLVPALRLLPFAKAASRPPPLVPVALVLHKLPVFHYCHWVTPDLIGIQIDFVYGRLILVCIGIVIRLVRVLLLGSHQELAGRNRNPVILREARIARLGQGFGSFQAHLKIDRGG